MGKITAVNGAIAAGDLIADVLGPEALDPDERVVVPDLVPAGAEVGRRHGGDPAQHGRRARARPAAGAAPRQGHPVQRAARQGAPGGGVMNFELSDEQVLLREAARDAFSPRKNGRGGARGARGRRAAGPVADRARGRLDRPADLRGARRRRARRDRRDARGGRGRPRARERAAARAPAGDGAARRAAGSTTRRSASSPRGELRAAYVPARPADDVDAGLDGRAAQRPAPRAGAAGRARRRGPRDGERLGRVGARRGRRRRPGRRRRRTRSGPVAVAFGPAPTACRSRRRPASTTPRARSAT